MNPPKIEPPKQYCFMIMPFGTKATNVTGSAPVKVNFDHLWEKSIEPALEELGFVAVRADQDDGALIIKDMLERIVASDLVVADVSIANANVYYELGVRHAAKKEGCVLIAANWAKPVFDIEQFRRIPYPLANQRVTDDEATCIKNLLVERIKEKIASKSPVFESIPNFPNVKKSDLSVFQADLKSLDGFQKEIKIIRRLEGDVQEERRKALVVKCSRQERLSPSAWIDLLNLTIEGSNWEEVLELIEAMPETLKNLEIVLEKKALGLSKMGCHFEAIAELETLVEKFGVTSERCGLLGGRFKALHYQEFNSHYLNEAINAYEKGMQLDLNNYFPACNLPRLLRDRGEPGDGNRANEICVIIGEACQVAENQGNADIWLDSTRLGLAFDTGNIELAKAMQKKLDSVRIVAWMSETLRLDLEKSLSQVKNPKSKQQLASIFDHLKTN